MIQPRQKSLLKVMFDRWLDHDPEVHLAMADLLLEVGEDERAECVRRGEAWCGLLYDMVRWGRGDRRSAAADGWRLTKNPGPDRRSDIWLDRCRHTGNFVSQRQVMCFVWHRAARYRYSCPARALARMYNSPGHGYRTVRTILFRADGRPIDVPCPVCCYPTDIQNPMRYADDTAMCRFCVDDIPPVNRYPVVHELD